MTVSTQSEPSHRTSVPLRVVGLALWFGVLAAWVELGILGYRKYIQHRPSFGMPERVSLLASYRVFWTVPVAESLTLLAAVLVIALAALRWKGRATVMAAGFLTGVLAMLSVLLNFTWLHPLAVTALSLGAGIKVAGWSGATSGTLHGLVRRSLAWMVGLVVVSGGGVSIWHALGERGALRGPSAKEGAPNVLLIILDTVRGFNLSTYGYQRETTPNLTKLAQRGVLFERAYASAPWTLPSHASMFTGRYPSELTADMQSSLSVKWPTIAEQMTARGYATAGFVANLGYTSAETGLARGFAHYEDHVLSRGSILNSSTILRVASLLPGIGRFLGPEPGVERKDADRINRDFLAWLPTTKERPFFVFLNYYDAHRPYHAPRPYDTTYLKSRRRLRTVLQVKGKTKLPAGADTVLTDAYDGALAYLDSRIAQLMSELDRRGALRNTVVIITSDHGEQFGEHGLFYHANSLYTQLLRVPLLMFGTDRVPANARVSHHVSLRDLAPTILDLADGSGPAPFPGRSLTRYFGNGASDSPAVGAELGGSAQQIADFAPPVRGMWSIVAGKWHYIRSGENTITGAESREELYDVEADSLEVRDLASTDSGRLWLARLRAGIDSVLPPEGGADGRRPIPAASGPIARSQNPERRPTTRKR